ncbi:hypothetical protein PR202_gb17139 [Eleusine coracana subsp. coracana]|uniref:Uncharacterized protein n=1 Tax=Eleusine coracana subsp. coracana TaxID=191504 RepID=A0AAV5F3E8_ELECO|nr:hypothetical protein QOZ80_6BG0470250 [Eleusine coracana subsp. coracana]GJN28960.1 hypothetical protein PR202_gb17139 [Eleusine coracana subsp. coracana]
MPQQQLEPWFLSVAALGALYLAAAAFRLLAHLAVCLRRPTDLRRRYGAWAVVTGPTSGIGRSMALELARRGLNLVLVGRDPAKLRDISETLVSVHGVKTKTVVFDLALTSTPQGDEAARRLRDAVDGLDIGVLVNNAGVAKPCAVYLHEFDVETWVRMVRVNLWALTEVTAVVLPGMVARGRGAVVNIGSGSTEAIPSFPLYSIYAATKRYVSQLSRSLYVEYKSKGIDVQCQAPLFVDTKMASSVTKSKRSSPFVPSSDAYARAAVRWIGHGPLCVPNVGHRLQACLCAAVPDCIHDWLRLREHLRQRALFQRLRAARGAPPRTTTTTESEASRDTS